MRSRLGILAVMGLVLGLPRPAAAWHKEGHMAVARFAWQQLGDKPKAQLQTLLTKHPHYGIYLSAERPKDVNLSEGEWAFVRAATWPDWVRDPRAPGLTKDEAHAIKIKFNKPNWHFVNLPYLHPDEAGQFDAAAIRKKALAPEFDGKGEPRHALAALKQCLRRLRDPQTPDPDKAVQLCWLLHLVGDLHQPLHATTLIASAKTFDPSFPPPHGDEGGNRLAIKVKPGDAEAMILHFYWDALLFSQEPPFQVVDATVASWRKADKYRRDQLPELAATAFLAWAEESLAKAKEVAYRGGGAFLKARPLPAHKEANLKGLDAPPLPAGYGKAAAAVAERRMVLAGYRLADQLLLALGAPK